MTDKFSLEAQRILGLSLAFARELGHTYIGTEHLLLAFLSDRESSVGRLLTASGADHDRARIMITQSIGQGSRSIDSVSAVTPTLRKVIENASISETRNEVSAESLLSAMLREKNASAIKLLVSQGCKVADILHKLDGLPSTEWTEPIRTPIKKQKKSDERLPSLQKYAQNMTSEALCKEYDPLIGRSLEIDRIMRILMRRSKNNPCLIGDPGVGKTAIVEELARRILNGNVPEGLEDCRIYSLDLASMLAGAKYRGDFEERMKLVIDEVSKNPSVILFIDELHTAIGAGSAEGAIDAANIIKPALARSKIKIIGATTLEEYRRHIEKDPAFERRFQKVNVSEPSLEESVEILRGLRAKYELHHGVKISDEAIDTAVRLSHLYVNDRFLPDKAIDLIDESSARLKLESFLSESAMKASETVLRLALGTATSAYSDGTDTAERGERLSPSAYVLGSEDIARTLTEWTSIPLQKLSADEESKFLNLEGELSERVIGQDRAVKRVSAAIRRGKTGLRDVARPIGSFIFAGPTGVGKTELAKALAHALYGSESAITRFDMSEFSEPHSVSRLIGAPPGYLGYDDGGQLCERIRRNPHHILLFDEIEKAHRDVFDLLLKVMDEGELSDSHGRKINFRSTVIIMTSNIGADISDSLSHSLGFIPSGEKESELMYKKLSEVFSPEFLSRPDEIILFSDLTLESKIKICQKLLLELSGRLGSSGISVEISDSVARLIISSCDKTGGARDIRRRISELIEDPLSLRLLSDSKVREDHLRISSDGEKIVFV